MIPPPKNPNKTQNAAGVTATGLGKRYDDLWALKDLDLEVPQGTVLGLLGHNGAGKTTAIRILTTLSEATTGSATVAGFDVASEPTQVRSHMGLAGQAATVDNLLSARANLELVGRLYHLPKAEAHKRADELLERLSLADVANKLVRDFSGGMRRRLDLAASFVASPPVLFLDEPTTGLDPHSRNELWEVLRERIAEGATVVLTTQYLDEADELADDIVVLDHGTVMAKGSPAELKAKLGGERVQVSVESASDLDPAAKALEPFADGHAVPDPESLVVTVPLRAGTSFLELARALDGAGVKARDVHRREPTLDDVFLTITDSRFATEKKKEVAA